MNIIKKVLNKIYTSYLNNFKTISLARGTWVDYRNEIDIKTNIVIGEKSILYKQVTIYKKKEGKFFMGETSHVAPYGYFLIDRHTVKIGDAVVIGKNCSFFCVSNAISSSNKLFKDSYISGDILLGNNIFIGANCVVLPNTKIGDNIVIASNSTVKGELEANFLYGGNPVKKIKKVYDV